MPSLQILLGDDEVFPGVAFALSHAEIVRAGAAVTYPAYRADGKTRIYICVRRDGDDSWWMPTFIMPGVSRVEVPAERVGHVSWLTSSCHVHVLTFFRIPVSAIPAAVSVGKDRSTVGHRNRLTPDALAAMLRDIAAARDGTLPWGTLVCVPSGSAGHPGPEELAKALAARKRQLGLHVQRLQGQLGGMFPGELKRRTHAEWNAAMQQLSDVKARLADANRRVTSRRDARHVERASDIRGNPVAIVKAAMHLLAIAYKGVLPDAQPDDLQEFFAAAKEFISDSAATSDGGRQR